MVAFVIQIKVPPDPSTEQVKVASSPGQTQRLLGESDPPTAPTKRISGQIVVAIIVQRYSSGMRILYIYSHMSFSHCAHAHFMLCVIHFCSETDTVHVVYFCCTRTKCV